MVISPSVGVSTPASNLAKVDFPAPFAPQTAEHAAGVTLQIDAVQRLDPGVVLLHPDRLERQLPHRQLVGLLFYLFSAVTMARGLLLVVVKPVGSNVGGDRGTPDAHACGCTMTLTVCSSRRPAVRASSTCASP